MTALAELSLNPDTDSMEGLVLVRLSMEMRTAHDDGVNDACMRGRHTTINPLET